MRHLYNLTFKRIGKSLIFQIVERSHLLSLYSKLLRERSVAENYHVLSLLSVVSKIFEKLVCNRLVDHLCEYGYSPF